MTDRSDIPISAKGHLVNAEGIEYREFRASLKQRYVLLWIQIALTHVAIASMLVALVIWDPDAVWAIVPGVLLGASSSATPSRRSGTTSMRLRIKTSW